MQKSKISCKENSQKKVLLFYLITEKVFFLRTQGRRTCFLGVEPLRSPPSFFSFAENKVFFCNREAAKKVLLLMARPLRRGEGGKGPGH